MGEPRVYPLSEWHEDLGDVLWWKFPIVEPPYVGSPRDLGFTVEVEIRTYVKAKTVRQSVGGWPGYHTHFTIINQPADPARLSRTGDQP